MKRAGKVRRMSEYTPTRQELIAAWIIAHQEEGWGGQVDMGGSPKERIAEAHRGIAEVERAAAEKLNAELEARIEDRDYWYRIAAEAKDQDMSGAVMTEGRKRRLRACVEAWPEAETFGYDPACCRFPKSCSATVYDEQYVTSAELEEAPGDD